MFWAIDPWDGHRGSAGKQKPEGGSVDRTIWFRSCHALSALERYLFLVPRAAPGLSPVCALGFPELRFLAPGSWLLAPGSWLLAPRLPAQCPLEPSVQRPENPREKLPCNKQSEESRYGAATESLVGTSHFVVQKKKRQRTAIEGRQRD
jgi:hypothetical protein